MGSIVTDPENATEALLIRNAAYIHVSMMVLMVHDWLILFDREIEYVWRASWHIGRILYLISRYGPLLDMPITIVLHLVPYGAISYDTCNILYKFSTWCIFFGMTFSELILVLRTNAIYSGSRQVAIPLSIFYLIGTAAGVISTCFHLRVIVYGPPPSDLFIGCVPVHPSGVGFFNFLALLLFELVIVTLTVRHGYRDFRSGTPLLRVVYRDSILSFLVLFVLSLSILFVYPLAPFSGAVATSIRTAHSIVCCRMLLNLRQAVHPEGTSTHAPELSGLVFATYPENRTDQPDTIQVDGCYVTRRDQENCGGERTGYLAHRLVEEVKPGSKVVGGEGPS